MRVLVVMAVGLVLAMGGTADAAWPPLSDTPLNTNPDVRGAPVTTPMGTGALVAWSEKPSGGKVQIKVVRRTTTATQNLPAPAKVNPDADAQVYGAATVGGTVWLTWQEVQGDTSRVHAAYYDGSAWMAPDGALNADPNATATDPAIASVGGVPYVTWSEDQPGGSVIRVKRYVANAWSFVGNPITADATRPALQPTIIDEGGGTPAVAFVQQDADGLSLHAVEFDEGSWSALGGAISTPGLLAYNTPALGIIGGRLSVAYLEASDTPFTRNVWVSRFAEGEWSRYGGVIDSYGALFAGPDFTLREFGGTPYLAYTRFEGGAIVAKFTGSEWQRTTLDAGAGEASVPALGSLGGTPFAVWRQDIPNATALVAAVEALPTTERVSVSSAEAQGDGESSRPTASEDGRYVAFESTSTNFFAGDSLNQGDVFLRDRLTGDTELISATPGGQPGQSNSYTPSVSADGRYVAFQSYANDLVSGDTNGAPDIFVRDRQTDTTERINVSSAGVPTVFGVDSQDPTISPDGRFVTFTSSSSALTPNDTNGVTDVFIRDLETSTTERISVSSDETGGNEGSGGHADLSDDGRYVAFFSSSSDLVAGDTNGKWDIFVRDREAGTTERVSLGNGGVQGNDDAIYTDMSADGRYVAFDSAASNLVSGDSNGTKDVFVRDRQAATTERVSVGPGGVQGNGVAVKPSISADGNRVAFLSGATNLGYTDTNGTFDGFVRDRRDATTEAVSLRADGTLGNGLTQDPAISADGTYVAFWSYATDLVSGDTNDKVDVFGRGFPPRASTPPSAPTVSTVSPASPANDNSPKIIGTAAAGSTVHLYGNATCTGAELASGTAAAFASPGLAITVADNSTTTVFATASNGAGTSACSSTSVTYVEDSSLPVVRFFSATTSVPESVGTVGFIVERTGSTAGTTNVAYTTKDGTAKAPADYGTKTGTVTFAPGDDQARVEVPYVDDSADEGDETMSLELSDPSAGASLGPPKTLTVTITDDDRIDTAITFGPDGYTTSASPQFLFTADPAAGATFECALDGGGFSACTSPFGASGLADGEHTFRVRAVLPNGSKDATPATRTFVVDTVRPEAQITVSGKKLTSGRYDGPVTVAATGSDAGSGVAELRCQADESPAPDTASDLRGDCPLTISTPGEHTVYAAAIDKAGGAGIPAKVTFTIAPAPDTTITSAPSKPLWIKAAEFAFTSGTTGATFRCRVDSAPFAACTSPYVTGALTSGDHVFEVAAVSPDGVVDPTPARATFTVEGEHRAGGTCVVNNFPQRVRRDLHNKVGCDFNTGEYQEYGCAAPNKCRRLTEHCPAGAQCILEAKTSWFDADTKVWEAEAGVRLNSQSSGAERRNYCTAGLRQDRCAVSAQLTGLGTSGFIAVFCQGHDGVPPVDPPNPYPDFGPDNVRRVECDASVVIKPATPLLTVATAGGVQVAAPGAGTVTVSPFAGGRSAAISRKRTPVFKAKPVVMKKAGAANVRFTLSKKAKKTLRRTHRLTLRVTAAFKPTGAAKASRRTTKVTLRTPAKRKRR